MLKEYVTSTCWNWKVLYLGKVHFHLQLADPWIILSCYYQRQELLYFVLSKSFHELFWHKNTFFSSYNFFQYLNNLLPLTPREVTVMSVNEWKHKFTCTNITPKKRKKRKVFYTSCACLRIGKKERRIKQRNISNWIRSSVTKRSLRTSKLPWRAIRTSFVYLVRVYRGRHYHKRDIMFPWKVWHKDSNTITFIWLRNRIHRWFIAAEEWKRCWVGHFSPTPPGTGVFVQRPPSEDRYPFVPLTRTEEICMRRPRLKYLIFHRSLREWIHHFHAWLNKPHGEVVSTIVVTIVLILEMSRNSIIKDFFSFHRQWFFFQDQLKRDKSANQFSHDENAHPCYYFYLTHLIWLSEQTGSINLKETVFHPTQIWLIWIPRFSIFSMASFNFSVKIHFTQ